MLTEQQIVLLEKAFDLDEHDFTDGKVYIRKSAIRRRLFRVDPAWSLGAPEFVMMAGEDVAVMRGALTICGVTRHGLGTGRIDRKAGGKDLEGVSLNNQIIKAFKAAASDILTRAALEFNVGAYLKDKPRDVKEANFAAWLAKLPASKIHWAANGGKARVTALMTEFGLTWERVSAEVEPGRKLAGLGETSLTEIQFVARMAALAFQPATTAS